MDEVSADNSPSTGSTLPWVGTETLKKRAVDKCKLKRDRRDDSRTASLAKESKRAKSDHVLRNWPLVLWQSIL